MNDFEEQQTKLVTESAERSAQLYQVVEEFLNNFGKENALYPTRTFVQIDASQLQKLARIFYLQKP